MAQGISLSVRRGLMLLYALVISVARAQEQIAVPGCAGCVVGCVTEVQGFSTLTTLQVVCATSTAACAICIASSTSIAFSRASSSAGSNVPGGCSAQLPFAATILEECTAGSISVPTATASGTRPSDDIPSGVSPPTDAINPGGLASSTASTPAIFPTAVTSTPTSTSLGNEGLSGNGGAGNTDTTSSTTSNGLAPGAIAGIAVGAAVILGAIIAAAFILRSRRRKSVLDPEPDLDVDSHPQIVENHVASVLPPKAEKSPAASIEAKPTEVFNPYPGPNDNSQ